MTSIHQLRESIFYSSAQGFKDVDIHYRRLSRSAAHFNYPCDLSKLERHMAALTAQVESDLAYKCHIRLHASGEFQVELLPLTAEYYQRPFLIGLGYRPYDQDKGWFMHKTTRQETFGWYCHTLDRFRQEHPGAFDIVFFDEAGWLTEGCRTNVYVQSGAEIWTPPLSLGILPGIARAKLLASGRVIERPFAVSDFEQAEQIYISNSMIGFQLARCVVRFTDHLDCVP